MTLYISFRPSLQKQNFKYQYKLLKTTEKQNWYKKLFMTLYMSTQLYIIHTHELEGETQNDITKMVKYWGGSFFLRNCCLYLDFWYVSLSTSISAWASWKWHWTKVMNINVQIFQLPTTSGEVWILHEWKFDVTTIFMILFRK